jgi:nucleotide-binding universal stress UspA family protein
LVRGHLWLNRILPFEGPLLHHSQRHSFDHPVIELFYEEIAMPKMDDRSILNLKTVVYATDFSLCSLNAGNYAAQMAAYFSAKLLVTHAFTLSQAAMEVETGDRRLSQQRKDLTRLLSQEATFLGIDSIEAIPTLLEGNPKDAIPELADREEPSMIVLGTHGGGRMERGIIGSVAEEILRSTRWPALTVGPHVQFVSSKSFPFERILIAADFTPAAANAVTYAVTLAEMLGAEIDVLNVIQDDAIEHPDRLSDLQSRFYSALDELVPQKTKEFCDPRTFVAIGDAHNRVIEHIRERSIDLLVLGIRNTSHLSMEMRTSGAFRIIVDAECPVLTIRK